MFGQSEESKKLLTFKGNWVKVYIPKYFIRRCFDKKGRKDLTFYERRLLVTKREEIEKKILQLQHTQSVIEASLNKYFYYED